jgi:predicted dehydrogenase
MSSPTDTRSGSSGGFLSSHVATRLRVGLIVLDRSGMFHAERLSLRPEIDVVAAADPTGGPAPRLPGPRLAGCPVYARLESLLEREDVDLVLIAGPAAHRADWARAALTTGKHVALESPPCLDSPQMRELLMTARQEKRHLSVLPSRRGSTEFATALSIARAGHLGRLSSARLLSWGTAVPHGESAALSGKRAPQDDFDAFALFAWQYVDQLLQLIPERPRSVFARIADHSPDEPESTAFTLTIAFEPGIEALIDVNLKSAATLSTGWILAGARGGASGGRIYLQEATGEISDHPVSPSDLPQIDPYSELLASLGGEPGPTASARDAEIVMGVIDAARESARTDRVITFDPKVG